MKSVLPVKMLAALALVLLVFSATEGRILSKCELKAQLDAAQFQQITVMGENITVNNLIARLVCRANSSAFNTSFVKAITVNNKENKPAQAPPQAKSGSPPKPHARDPPKPHAQDPPKPNAQDPLKPHTEDPSKPHARDPPKPNTQARTEGPQGLRHKAKHPHLNDTDNVSGKLYGVFQLSDQLACDSGMIPSLNVCNMSCSEEGQWTALTDDDISNDITCLKTMMNRMTSKSKEKHTDVNKLLEKLMVKQCHSVDPSKYFADCA